MPRPPGAEEDLSVFKVLRGILENSEYDATQWHNGELEIYIGDGLIITCYTPVERGGTQHPPATS